MCVSGLFRGADNPKGRRCVPFLTCRDIFGDLRFLILNISTLFIPSTDTLSYSTDLGFARSNEFADLCVKVEYAFREGERAAQTLTTLRDNEGEEDTREDSRRRASLLELAMV